MSVDSVRFLPVKALNWALLTLSIALAGCSTIVPSPLKVAEIEGQAKIDRAQAQQGVEPLSGPLSLDEAIARALKYNLDRRVKLTEEAIAFNQLDISNYDMLPRLVATYGYRDRSEYAISRASDSVTGAPSLANPFVSSDRAHNSLDLGLTWSILDVGLSYYGAKQNADRALIAMERRRRAMHILMQDVRSAYWRTVSAQKLRKDLQASIALANEALADAKKAEDERLRSPLDSLRYQRQTLDTMRLLESIEQDLSSARVELATLINAPLGLDLVVEESAEVVNKQILEIPVQNLEEVAIARNADLREHFYNVRIASDETRRTMAKLFPNLSFNYTLKTDSDKYLVNNRWNEVGAQISYNLINILSAPTQMKYAKAEADLAEQRRAAGLMAVLAQVHLARLQYESALKQYGRADAIWAVDDRINNLVSNREQAQVTNKLDRIASSTASILSLLRRYQSLAQVHTAASKLQATLGMEPEFTSVQDTSLADLKSAVKDSIQRWEKADLSAKSMSAGE
jgi:outer membrane protein TolC